MASAYGAKTKQLLLILLSAQQSVMKITISTNVSSVSAMGNNQGKPIQQ